MKSENIKLMKKYLVINFLLIISLLFLLSCAAEPEAEIVVKETIVEAPLEPVEAVPPLTDEAVEEVGAESSVSAGANLTSVHTIYFTADGFEPEVINITKGDTIVWINQREKLSALVVGAYTCAKTRSPVLQPGDEFQWTFNKMEKCVVTDGIFPAEILTIYVNE